MKRLVTAALSAIMLISCVSHSPDSESAELQTEQNIAEIELTNDPSSSAPKSLSASTVIYRERLYNTDSITKSDLIIQSDGRVWCGFYTHDEGSIDKFNRLWTSEDEFSTNYQLADDLWLDSIMTETRDDDFMLFDETSELTSLSSEELEKLSSLIGSTDPFSACNVYTVPEAAVDPDIIDTEYNFIDLVIGRNVCRAYEYTQSYKSMVQDENAAEVIDQIHKSSYYTDWREICSRNILPSEQ